MGICITSPGQQNLSNYFLSASNDFSTESLKALHSDDRKSQRKQLALKLPFAGLAGASNLNEETFKNLNASGKASFYFRPVIYRNKALTVFASYNINATNNDSILYSTLIFPEIGKNSFLGTIEWRTYWSTPTLKGSYGHSLAPFFEFSHKNIRADSSEKNKPLSFATLNYTAGIKYTFNVFKKGEDENDTGTEASLFISAYLSSLNIPDEDIDSYRAVLSKGQSIDPATLTDDFRSIGIKIGGQFKSFGIFADFRAVLGKESKIPLKDLRGFHSNIGLLINAEIFHINL